MNVCFLHAGFSNAGGIERAVSMIMNALSKEKHVKLFSLGFIKPEKENIYPVNPNISDDSLYTFRLSMFSALLKHRGIQKTMKYIKENNIDIIIGCGSPYFLLAVIAAKICRIKSICWEHTNPKIENEFKCQRN